MATFVHKAEYARHRGVHRSLITMWQKRGFLVLSEDSRLVNVEASDALLDARPAVHNGGVCSPPSQQKNRSAAKALSGESLEGKASEKPENRHVAPAEIVSAWTTAEAIRRKESANARIRQLEFEIKAGGMLPAGEVEASWRAHITDARKRLLTVPSRCASRLSHLSRAEVEVIDREIRDALQDLVGSVNRGE